VTVVYLTHLSESRFACICHYSECGNGLFLDVTFRLFCVVASWVEKFEAFNDWIRIRNESVYCNTFTKIDECRSYMKVDTAPNRVIGMVIGK
jgi:hypothetical protein